MVSTSKDPLTFNDLMATSIDFSKYVLNGLKIKNLTQDILLGSAFSLLKGTCSSKGDHYPFDLSKPLPLQGPPGHRTIAADYFFNNDLEYLKTFDPEVTYTTSITKTKNARYEIKGIEDMAILGVKSVSVNKLHGYGHLEEIVVKRSDQQLYKFKEGDFVDLNLNNIEDMLLLAIQHKLFHLDGNVIVDFIVALRMFTRSLILKRRVKDLQLGVESYQRSLTSPNLRRPFQRLNSKNPTLHHTSVRDEIHHRVLDFRLDYNPEMPKRKWTVVDRKRLGLMIELIDKQLREREIIRNLERLVGARELEMDYKLMTHNVKTRNISRVLRIILVILPEHPSDTKVFTVKMEILLEPTSNKLLVDTPVMRTTSTVAKPCQGDSLEFYLITGADIAKITRKRLKPGKHEHENGRAHKKPGEG
ncbi:hypothetical protein Tco_1114124 [Tanacetum coccineum]|uniref:Uncharacterized protein n=1 Tax=Tanacetum coccineum TaxID=301880 RepID=A0ABQ5IV95_9ASTR